MMTERDRRVVRLANELVRRHALTLPVDVAAVCPIYGARLLSLSELEQKGLDAEAVFAVWGNRDGVAMASRRGRTIGYNDRAAEKRVRFTLAEELMHLLLGHTEDERFRLGEQSYDAGTYALYEAEAKRGACMLLVPPCCSCRRRSTSATASFTASAGSRACAWTAAQYYDENEKELRALFTARPLKCDTRGLTRRSPLRPLRL